MSWLNDIQRHLSTPKEKVDPGFQTTRQIAKECKKSMTWVQRKIGRLQEYNLVETKTFMVPNSIGVLRPAPHYKLKK